MLKRFPFYKQHDEQDCGPACLRMIAKHYGQTYSLGELRKLSNVGAAGATLMDLSRAAEQIGLRSLAAELDAEALFSKVPLPCIAFWNQNHFVVVYEASRDTVSIADPGSGHHTISREAFLEGWASRDRGGKGIVLLVEPTARFYEDDDRAGPSNHGLTSLLGYVRPYGSLVTQLVLGLLVGSLIQLVLPFLTQAVVDVGIGTRSVSFIYLILAGQIVLMASRVTVEFIRRWILLHLSTRVNISLISDFLFKLVRLPISFFDTRSTGDILQRVDDHARVEQFLSMSSLSVIFSMFNLLVFAVVLAVYHVPILLVFLVGSILYVAYVLLFLRRRRQLDYERFAELSAQQNRVLQMVHGIQEIKLNNCEQEKRWEWERGQARLFRVNVKAMALSQYQQTGAFLLNEVKNVLITFMSAMAVIEGAMTLGMMLAVQYIVGQLNGPLNELIRFIEELQDAKISLERIGDIADHPPEHMPGAERTLAPRHAEPIRLNKVTFRYPGSSGPPVLRDVSFEIEPGTTTAIVGASGSGKTTLLKLLLRFHEPSAGEIKVGGVPLTAFDPDTWRSVCGVVMQNGFIFADTVAGNIAVTGTRLDMERLRDAARLANIDRFIESLPYAYDTVVGSNGVRLSEGQRQRLLIARALYKNPLYLFFDEATSSLDAANERSIVENLYDLSGTKTLLVIAHRLSTVQQADRIVVLDDGQVAEVGTHDELVARGGVYLELVRNQLQLTEARVTAGPAPGGIQPS